MSAGLTPFGEAKYKPNEVVNKSFQDNPIIHLGVIMQEEILKSRTETTQILGNALLECKNPPLLWINSSTATIYRHAEDRPMTEENGDIGSGFSVDVAKAWEQVFFSFQLPQTRQIALRMAIETYLILSFF